MVDYILSERAKDQLKDIYKQGYTDFGEAQAEKYYMSLCKRFEEIAEQPLLYPAVNDIREGYRRSVCGKHSIFYSMTDSRIEIMAVLKRQNIIDFIT